MNIVLVQHNEQSAKKYCFAVPDNLVAHVEYGVNVICDTRRGHMPGKVVSQIMSGEDADRILTENHATTPLKSILSVVKQIDISNVRIPIAMELSKPRKDKLARRKQELSALGCVKTDVKIDDDGILRDGYTAYLVCKNKGMSSIPVAVGA